MANQQQAIKSKIIQFRSRCAENLPQQLGTLGQAIQQARRRSDNAESIIQAISLAHKLRGAASSCGFNEVSMLATDIEDTLVRHKTNPLWAKSCDQLLEGLSRSRERILHGSVAFQEDFHPTTRRPQYQGHILIVHDNPEFQSFVDEILAGYGFQVTTTDNSQQVRNILETSRPDLVLLHIEMPDKTGFDVCRAIKTSTEWKDIPVIFLTVHNTVENRMMAFQAKADDFINKPIIEEELMARILVRLEHARFQSERQSMLTRIQAQHKAMLAILNQLQVGSIMIDDNARILFMSDACQQFLGLDERQSIPTLWHELSVFSKKHVEQLQAILKQEEKQRSRVQLSIAPSLNVRYKLDVEVRDDPSQSGRHIIFFYDVTEVRDLRGALIQSRHGGLVGSSQAMRELLDRTKKVARGDWTVLIEGETGVGKELVAKSIHDASPRKGKPFIAVNCAGLSESLIASQLFGHRRGAFTGAFSDQKGLFEAADGGTLFLDEIGDIPMSVQIILLRVLQEKEIIPVGETRPRKVDVRILVATHRNLNEEVAAGRFRQDLLYRIQVARIEVPLLRDHKEDIPLLVATFLGQDRVASAERIDDFSKEAMQCMLSYHWPGNVRELKNTVKFALISCDSSIIGINDLPHEIRDAVVESRTPPDERSRIIEVLRATNGNRTRAAKILGIGRATLYRRIDGLSIESKNWSTDPKAL